MSKPIKQVAIKINGVICTMPRPARHHSIIHALKGMGMKPSAYQYQGFIDEGGNYLNRLEARERAIATGQVKAEDTITRNELFSEDLWQ